jgi:hypothetical protein
VFTSPNKPNVELARSLTKIIDEASSFAPRSKQKAIGPSEAGTECTRKLAYKLLDWEKVNEGSSFSWAATVGTAIHSHLANIFNKIEGFEVEQKVQIRPGLAGSIDLFHIPSGTVIDWKTTSPSALPQKKKYPSKQNLVQVQLYAYGKALSGVEVKQVALVYLPTSGSLDDMHIELHDYNEQIALDALDRIDNIYALLTAADVEANPAMWEQIPKEAGRLCMYCPYFQPFSKDLARACNGDTDAA